LRNYRWTQVAQSVITVSENSRKDIVRLCRVPPEKVRVTHLGIDEEFLAVTPVSETQSVLAKFKVDGKRYVVNIGGFNQPRRNPEFILRGFARYLKETNDDCYLVVTGSILKFAGFYDRVCALIRELGLEERVITTGWVTTPELKVLIENAQVSVITSLYEGFCLPLTESFACGVAVIANDRGSIPEIAAGAAVLVDPFDPAGLALELGLLLKDKKARETWAARGRRRAADFSWERTAAGTWEAYRSVMAGQKTGR
jgi:glycosyltransferase involved in cell wall biosynthesis